MSGKRKTKKDWRKNVDLTEIEDQLEELRTEEILGGKLHERDSSELFRIDTTGDEKMQRAIKNKTLKIDEIIKPKSAIEAMVRPRKSTTVPTDTGYKVRQVSKQIQLKIEQEASKKKKQGKFPGSAVQEKRAIKKRKIEEIKAAKGGYDLWNDKEEQVDPYLEPAVKKKVRRPAVDYKLPNAIPAVQVVHPGASYQPDQKDHKEAILLAASEEIKKIEEKEVIEEKLSYPKELDQLPDETFFGEESEPEDESEVEGEGEEIVKPKSKPKTRAELNRKKKAKEQELKEKQLKEEKLLLKQINKIKEIEKELLAKDLKNEERLKLKKALKELQDATKTKRLGRYQFKPTPMEIQLKEEIAEDLLHLKPEGNLVKDRFQSLQRRNLIETRVVVKPKRKYKIKEVESHDYKRFK